MDKLHETVGKVKEEVGWATGDREVEAEGKAEETRGDDPAPGEVEAEKEEVRREHGDVR